MPQFNAEKFIDFVENYDSKNANHRASMLDFANDVIQVNSGLLTDEADWVKLFRTPVQNSSAKPASPSDKDGVIQEYKTLLKVSNFSQPNAYTCQSACIAMAVNDPNITGIRSKLQATGLDAGSPTAMARVIQSYTSKYKFESNACLDDVYKWLEKGEFLITHGWFTGSGHVICLDGLEINTQTLGHKISVKDPWSEFNASAWKYDKSSKFFDGYYSSHCIYAACVAGASVSNAKTLYNQKALDSARRGMWVHRFLV